MAGNLDAGSAWNEAGTADATDEDGANELVFDLRTAAVTGRLTVNGQPPGASAETCQFARAMLWFGGVDGDPGPPPADFRNQGGSEIPCEASAGAFSARVPFGRYRVVARTIDPWTRSPGPFFVVSSEFDVAGPVDGLHFDVTTATVRGHLLVDADAPGPPSTACALGANWSVVFVGPRGVSTGSVDCRGGASEYEVELQPGPYRVLVDAGGPYRALPSRRMLVSESFVVRGAMQGVDWNLHTVPVEGHVWVDRGSLRGPWLDCGSARPSIDFIGSHGDRASAPLSCAENDGRFATRLPPGVYDVEARGFINSGVQVDTLTLARGVAITEPRTDLDWQVDTVPVAARITVDGSTPVLVPGRSFLAVYFQSRNGGEFESLGESAGDRLTTRVLPGRYTVLAGVVGSASPWMTTVAEDFDASAGVSEQSWNIVTRPLTARLTVDGASPPAGEPGAPLQWLLNLTDSHGAASTYVFRERTDGRFSMRLGPGAYTIRAAWLDGNTYSVGSVTTGLLVP